MYGQEWVHAGGEYGCIETEGHGGWGGGWGMRGPSYRMYVEDIPQISMDWIFKGEPTASGRSPLPLITPLTRPPPPPPVAYTKSPRPRSGRAGKCRLVTDTLRSKCASTTLTSTNTRRQCLGADRTCLGSALARIGMDRRGRVLKYNAWHVCMSICI